MTDTPPVVSVPPPSRLEQWKAAIGDLARPFAIYVSAISAGWATIAIAYRVQSPTLESAAIFIGAIYAGLGVLYGAKAWEVAKTGGQAADVAKAQAGAS